MTLWKWTPSSLSATTTFVRGGMKQLQQFLHNEEHRFISSPIVLLTNTTSNLHHTNVDRNSMTISNPTKIQINATQQTQYLLQQQLGYQTFIATCGGGGGGGWGGGYRGGDGNATTTTTTTTTTTITTTPSYYPTTADIDNVLKLMHRVGAYNIVAVGTGNVMDVAKAIYNTNDMFDELVLIPTTYGASIASTSSHSLIHDTTDEDTLIAQPSNTAKKTYHTVKESSNRPPTTICMLHDEFDFNVTTTSIFDTITNRHITLFALLSIILDCIYQSITPMPLSLTQNHHNHTTATTTTPPLSHGPTSVLILNEFVRIVDDIMFCLEQNDIAIMSTTTTLSLETQQQQQEQHETLLHLCYEVGSYISYGLPIATQQQQQQQLQPRSLPIAMVASLSKSSSIAFSQYTATTIMASFVPAYCELILDKITSCHQFTNAAPTSQEKKIMKHLQRLLATTTNNDNDIAAGIPKIVTTESLSTLVSCIQTNQLIWSCYDNYYDHVAYTKLLRHHLLVY